VATFLRPVGAKAREALRQEMQIAMPPAQVADAVFQAIREERFYILTHPEGKNWIRTRMEDIFEERNPTPPGTALNQRLRQTVPALRLFVTCFHRAPC
jgi:hypothetical protein